MSCFIYILFPNPIIFLHRLSNFKDHWSHHTDAFITLKMASQAKAEF